MAAGQAHVAASPVQPVDSPLAFVAPPNAATAAAVAPPVFADVMLNLIRNPNITSTHLFRADILYDSAADASYAPAAADPGVPICALAPHMQWRLRPRRLAIAGFTLARTLVRELVPRNPALDARLPQTCHVYEDAAGGGRALVVYLPHVENAVEMPWYHPRVRALAFLHTWPTDFEGEGEGEGELSVHVAPFEGDDGSSDDRLARTLAKLLSTVAKHCKGRAAGYRKRVVHDTVVPQARFQDTYTRLKLRYAKALVDGWAEVTDPTKHVFEDLGIAAFLIELWRDMYGIAPVEERRDGQAAGAFPGFVDIGCGNGLLVHVLLSEGFEGWGFDVRARKSWAGYPIGSSERLRELVLVPMIFGQQEAAGTHNGVFPPGTFIVSNHADELTAWTPILARLSGNSPFLSIPCCSHDLGGSRTRFKPRPAKADGRSETDAAGLDVRGETDALPPQSTKGPSAYATLCQYVKHISDQVGYSTRTEMMRIPSTRNVGILGTYPELAKEGEDTKSEAGPGAFFDQESAIRLVEDEMEKRIQAVADAWVDRAGKIRSSKGSGH